MLGRNWLKGNNWFVPPLLFTILIKLFLTLSSPHLCALHSHTHPYSLLSALLAAGLTGSENSPCALLVHSHPPLFAYCSFPPSFPVCHRLAPFLSSLYPSYPQSLFSSVCHSTFLCHYSAHMSRLKRKPLLLASVFSLCGSASDTKSAVCMCYVCVKFFGLSSVLLSVWVRSLYNWEEDMLNV